MKQEEPHKIYKNISEWYHPDVDYFEMLENLRWTRTYMTDLMREKSKFKNDRFSFTNYEFPLDNIFLLEHSRQYIFTDKGEEIGKDQIFQFFNKQFNDELAKVIKGWGAKKILEVGAGNGWLSKMLELRGLNTIATDNGSWKLKTHYQVIQMGVQKALEEYQPDVVIACWMPMECEWTKYFRKTKSVKHYILIGENGGCCGGDWEEHAGWKEEDSSEIEAFSVSRTDDISPWNKGIYHNKGLVGLGRTHAQVGLFSLK